MKYEDLTLREKCGLLATFMGGNAEHTFVDENGEVDHLLFDMGSKDERVQNERYHSDTTMKYHSSWDWMHPVLDKLKSVGCVYTLSHQYCTLQTFDSEFKSSVGSDTTLEATFRCVVEFVLYYNENRK